MCLGEPRYQFRKSNSMKLALKEDEEGDLVVMMVASYFSYGVYIFNLLFSWFNLSLYELSRYSFLFVLWFCFLCLLFM